MPLIDRLLSVVAPHKCLVCSREGKLICVPCAQESIPPIPSRCYRCQALSSDFAVCQKCRRQTSLKNVWIRTSYERVAEQLLRLYKYSHAVSAHKVIAGIMQEVLPYLPSDTVVVGVPTATARQRQRGYDHAALLAREIAYKNDLTFITPLTRIGQARQVGAARQQRFEQLKRAFMVTKPAQVEGKQVLIVDDVVTTGATVERAAELLKKAGAKRVSALLFAQRFLI